MNEEPEKVYLIVRDHGPAGPIYVERNGVPRIFERQQDAVRAKVNEMGLPQRCEVVERPRSEFPDSTLE